MASKVQIVGCLSLLVIFGAQALQSSPASQSFLQTQKFVPAPPELPTTGGYNAVSTTMKCVINLTIQYIMNLLRLVRLRPFGLVQQRRWREHQSLQKV